MPYKSPFTAPFRNLPAGQPQLGFAPMVVAQAVATFASKIKDIGGLFKSGGPNWSGTASKALAAAIGNTGEKFEGMDARAFIEHYRLNANSQTGRDVYAAAAEQLRQSDALNPAQVPSSNVPGGIKMASTGSMTTPLLIGGAALAAFVIFRNRK